MCFCVICVVLSDSKKRKMYDAGLYDPDEEVDEVCCSSSVCFFLYPLFFGFVYVMNYTINNILNYFQGFADFVEEMASLIDKTRREVCFT